MEKVEPTNTAEMQKFPARQTTAEAHRPLTVNSGKRKFFCDYSTRTLKFGNLRNLTQRILRK